MINDKRYIIIIPLYCDTPFFFYFVTGSTIQCNGYLMLYVSVEVYSSLKIFFFRKSITRIFIGEISHPVSKTKNKK